MYRTFDDKRVEYFIKSPSVDILSTLVVLRLNYAGCISGVEMDDLIPTLSIKIVALYFCMKDRYDLHNYNGLLLCH